MKRVYLMAVRNLRKLTSFCGQTFDEPNACVPVFHSRLIIPVRTLNPSPGDITQQHSNQRAFLNRLNECKYSDDWRCWLSCTSGARLFTDIQLIPSSANCVNRGRQDCRAKVKLKRKWSASNDFSYYMYLIQSQQRSSRIHGSQWPDGSVSWSLAEADKAILAVLISLQFVLSIFCNATN